MLIRVALIKTQVICVEPIAKHCNFTEQIGASSRSNYCDLGGPLPCQYASMELIERWNSTSRSGHTLVLQICARSVCAVMPLLAWCLVRDACPLPPDKADFQLRRRGHPRRQAAA